jgi:tetratricopeptide (TPR) repeat protein
MELIRTDNRIKGLSIEDKQLEHLLSKHPYFHLGLMEKSKRYRKKNHIDTLSVERKCAILFPNRAKLSIDLQNKNEAIEKISSLIPTIDKKDDNNPGIDIDLKTDKESVEKELNTLEKEYLNEAIDQSIQLEVSSYSIENLEGNVDQTAKKIERILSFSEWIGDEIEGSIPHQSGLIDQFIQEKPQISKVSSSTFYSAIDKGKQSISEESLIFSETLADIFAKQGNYDLAIKAYRHLMLKNPQKSIYFADLIKKLEEKK